MKIAWFTPFYYKSAIGRYSKFATEELSKYVEIHIYTPHKKELHETFVPIVSFESVEVVNSLGEYDLCIYNMGDYLTYHALIFEVSKIKEGLVISHDVCMHNFMRGYLIERKNNEEKYKRLLQKYYGKETMVRITNAIVDSKKWNALNLAKYSMAEDLYNSALGVVVHSNYHRKYVKEYYKGSVDIIPMIDLNELEDVDESVEFKGYDTTKINLLTVGNINPNKKVDAVIQALGMNEDLKARFNYTVIGSRVDYNYMDKLEQLVDEYGLENNVKFLGFVEDELLAHYYLNADIIINLRYPAFEGGSATLVEQLSLGKAVVVSKTGVYDETPDDVVIKIGVKKEVKELSRVLKLIMQDLAMLTTYQTRAKEFAEIEYSRTKYANRLNEIINKIAFLSPLRNMITEVRQDLNQVGMYACSEQYIKNIADEIDALYSPKNK